MKVTVRRNIVKALMVNTETGDMYQKDFTLVRLPQKEENILNLLREMSVDPIAPVKIIDVEKAVSKTYEIDDDDFFEHAELVNVEFDEKAEVE